MTVEKEGYRLEACLFGEQGMFGALDESLDFADGYFLGKAVGTYLHHKHRDVYACVASDSHPLSLPLESEVVRGLLECGVRVLSFSISPAPLVRFAASELRAQVAFSVSRGSLPATHSGVKVFLEGSALDNARALQLRNIAASGNWHKSTRGRLAKSEGVEAYTTRLFSESAWRKGKGARDDTRSDARGGARGGARDDTRDGEGQALRMLPRVLLAQSQHGGLAEVLAAIAEKISPHAEQVLVLEDAAALPVALQEEREQLGFLFNSDGTALQVFLGGGRELSAEELFGLLLRGESFPSRARVVLTDGLVSGETSQSWQSLGARVVRCPHFGADLLTCLSSKDDVFATISFDGHIALCERYYPFEDAFYVALRFLSKLASGLMDMSALGNLPLRREAGLRRIVLRKQEGGGSFFGNKEALLLQLRSKVKAEGGDWRSDVAQEIERNFSYGRWIVRASRFEEVLFARCEGEDEEATTKVVTDLREVLASCGIESVLS